MVLYFLLKKKKYGIHYLSFWCPNLP